MKDLVFFIGFFVLIFLFGLSTSQNGGLFRGAATSTQSGTGSNTSISARGHPTRTSEQPVQKLSNQEIESRVASIYNQLDQLTEELRKQKLREPTSPYAGMVQLYTANVWTDDPKQEYLLLSAKSNNPSPVNISKWYLKSYVTEESAAITQGDRLLASWRHPVESDILLRPGESAYLITGKSPIDTSFHENMCTGYLRSQTNLYPGLSLSCPNPSSEMKKYGKIPLDDDSCYNYVNSLGSCTTVDYDTVAGKKLSAGCSYFLAHTFSHDACIVKHQHDPFFDTYGYWHIYLGQTTNLWRGQREIIRLMDENDKVVAVVEY